MALGDWFPPDTLVSRSFKLPRLGKARNRLTNRVCKKRRGSRTTSASFCQEFFSRALLGAVGQQRDTWAKAAFRARFSSASRSSNTMSGLDVEALLDQAAAARQILRHSTSSRFVRSSCQRASRAGEIAAAAVAVIASATAIEETTAIAAIATIVIGTVVITAIGTGAIGARPFRVTATDFDFDSGRRRPRP